MRTPKEVLFLVLGIVFLLALGLSKSAAGFEMTQVTMLDSMFNPVQFISPNNPVLVELYFNYSLGEGETFTGVYINASDIYPGGIYAGADYSHLTPSCTENSSVFSCAATSLTLKTSKATAVVYVHGVFSDGETTDPLENSTTLTFTVDKTNPQAVFLGTEYCFSGQCYIPSEKRSKIIIRLEDERATFAKALIGYRTGGTNGLVDHCDGMECIGTAKVTCMDNQKIILRLRHNGIVSRDDTGNKVSSIPVELACDATPPVIISYNITSETGTNALTLDKNLVFEMNVSDNASPIMNFTILADNIASGNITGTCSKPQIEGNSFQCRASFKASIQEPGKYKVTLVATDIVGGTINKEIDVELLKTVNQSINLWSVDSVEQSSNSFSRANMDYERTLFLKVNLRPIGQEASIISMQQGGTCNPVSNGTDGNPKTGYEGDVSSITLVTHKDKAAYIKLGIKENGDGRYYNISTLEFNCSLQISSKRGNYYFSSPETDDFTFKVNLKDEDSIQKKHLDEIAEYTKLIQNNEKLIDNIGKPIETVATICELIGDVEGLNSALGAIQGMLALFQYTHPAATALGRVTHPVDKLSNNAGKLKEICKYITCDSSTLNTATDSLNNIDTSGNINKVSNYLGYNSLSDSMNPYKSYVTALSTACLPAIVYHFRVYTGIECNYLSCISQEYVKYGQDLSQCQNNKAYSECVFIWGGIMDGLPFVSMVRDVATRVSEAVKDPVALVGLAVPTICYVLQSVEFLHGPCIFANNLLKATSSINIVKAMGSQLTNIFSDKTKPDGQCDDIVHEADRIVALYDLKHPERTMGNYPTFNYNSRKEMPDGSTIECKGSGCTYTTPDVVVSSVPAGYAGPPQLAPGTTYNVEFDNKGMMRIFSSDGKSQKLELTYFAGNNYNYESQSPGGVPSNVREELQKFNNERQKAFFEQYPMEIISKRLENANEEYESALQEYTKRATSGIDNMVEQTQHVDEIQNRMTELIGSKDPADIDEYNTLKVELDKLNNDIKSQVQSLAKEEEQVAEAKEKVDKLTAEATSDPEFAKNFGSMRSAMMSGWANVRYISNLRQTFNIDWGLWSENTFMGQASAWIMTNIAQPEKQWCRSKLDLDSSNTDEPTILNMVGENSYRSGAQIAGRGMLSNDLQGGEKKYTYWLRGNVVSYKANGLGVKIILKTDGGTEKDITSKISMDGSSPIILQEGVMFTFGGQTAYQISDKTLYEKVCMNFIGDTRNYFDIALSQGNKVPDHICQKIVMEEGTAGTS